MAGTIGGPEPSAHNVETGTCRSSVEQASSRLLVGVVPADDEAALAMGVPRQQRALLDEGHEIERGEA
jgi:hypothetical protein